MMTNRLILIVTAVVCMIVAGCTGRQPEPVAVVNGTPISRSEFQDRYHRYLQSTGVGDNIVIRKSILDNMVNEILIMEELKRMGLDHDAAAKAKFEDITMQSMLNAYGKKKILDTIQVSERELEEELRLSNTKARVRYVYAKTLDGAMELRKKLEAGMSFEALARDVFEDPGLATNGGSLGLMGRGEMEPAFDKMAFTLPIGELSEPVRIKIGYAIIRVDQRVTAPLASEYDFAKKKESLTDAVLERKIDSYTRQVAYFLSADLHPRFDENALTQLYEHWPSVVSPSVGDAEGLPRRMPFTDIGDRTLVTFKKGSWTIRNVFERTEKTSTRQRSMVHSRDDLKQFILGLMSREELLQRAERSGVGDDPEVRREIQNASLAWLLRRWRTFVLDSISAHGISDEDIQREYQATKEMHRFPPEVNVGEILVRTQAEADSLYRELRKGKDFATLARKHSIRLWAAKKGGELGFGSLSAFGILGKTFFSAPVGELIPPQRVDPYVGNFKILARREGRLKTRDEARDDIFQHLLAKRKQDGLTKALTSLRERATIQVNESAVANISSDV